MEFEGVRERIVQSVKELGVKPQPTSRVDGRSVEYRKEQV
jgi:hypothetical protein